MPPHDPVTRYSGSSRCLNELFLFEAYDLATNNSGNGSYIYDPDSHYYWEKTFAKPPNK